MVFLKKVDFMFLMTMFQIDIPKIPQKISRNALLVIIARKPL